MELHESVKIIEKLDRFYTSFNPDMETVKDWATELMAYQEHDAVWVWAQIKDAIVDEGSNFAPSIPWLLSELRCRANLERYQALPPPVEEPVVRLTEEEATREFAKIRAILKSAMPMKEEPPDIYRRAVSRSCDDLTEEE